MKDFIKHFRRGRDGSWTCIAHAEIRHPQGRIQVAEGARFTPGTIFMAVDIVTMLEQELHRLVAQFRNLLKTPYLVGHPCRPILSASQRTLSRI
jgi:hypothetical protein